MLKILRKEKEIEDLNIFMGCLEKYQALRYYDIYATVQNIIDICQIMANLVKL